MPRLPQELAASVDSCMRGCGPLRVQCLMSSQKFSGGFAAVAGAGAEAAVASSDMYGPFTHCAYSVGMAGASSSTSASEMMVCGCRGEGAPGGP